MTHPAPAPQVTVRPLRVTCIAADGAGANLLVELLASLLPGSQIVAIDPLSVRTVPDADCAVLDLTANEEGVLQTMRSLRARGFKAPVVCITEDGQSHHQDVLARLGISRTIQLSEAPTRLPRAILESTQLDTQSMASPGLARSLQSLRQTQRLLAAGEIAMKMQHSLNNPLAALLAEAQLLELEDLSPEHRRAVERIIELSRRLIEVTRTLEGIGCR